MESSKFISDFVVLRTSKYIVRSMHYNMRMMGVSVNGEANVFSKNKSVWKSASRLEATIKNKHVSLFFHSIREEVYIWIMHVGL